MLIEDLASGARDVGAQPDRLLGAGTAQIDVAVLQACFFPDLAGVLGVIGDLEGQGCTRIEDFHVLCDDLDGAGWQRIVLVALGPPVHGSGDLQDEFAAELVGDVLANDHLANPRGVAQVDKGDPAVIAATVHPAGEGNGLVNMFFAQVACAVCAEHGASFPNRCANRETGGRALESTADAGDNRLVTDIKPHFESDAFLRRLLWLSVTLITVGAFEALALTTVMPRVAEALNGDHLYAIAMGAPLATHVISTTFGGKWVDARGPFLPTITGCALAASGLVIAGLANHMEVVAIGRAVMGLGTGMLMVSLYAMVGSLVPTAKQPMFFAVFAAAWVVPSMFGPYFAGLIAEKYSWRVVFLAVVPILVLAILAMIPILKPLPRKHESVWKDHGAYRLVLIATGAGGGAALMQVVVARRSILAAILFLILAAGVFYLLRQLLPAGSLTAHKDQVGAAIATRMWINAPIVATESFLPLMLVKIHGWEVSSAGIILTIGGISWAIGSFVQGKIADPELRHRLPIIGGGLATIGILVAAFSALPFAPPLLTALGWLLAGAGIGLTLPAMSVVALGKTPQHEHGQISASLQIVDGIGAALAIGVVGFFQMVPYIVGNGKLDGNPFVPGLIFMALLAAFSTFTATRVPKLTASDNIGSAARAD